MKNQLLIFISSILLLFIGNLCPAQQLQFEWVRQMGGSSQWDGSNSIAIDHLGNVLTTGYFHNSGDFDPGANTFSLDAVGAIDCYVQKLDPLGNLLWAVNIGGTENDRGSSVKVDVDGNVYISGHFIGIVDFDPGLDVFNLNSLGNLNVFVLKLDANGNFIWAQQLGATNNGVVRDGVLYLDNDGNIVITGTFDGTADFDPGSNNFNMTSTGWDNDMFVTKLNPDGEFVWAKRMGGYAQAQGNSVVTNSVGAIFITGNFQGTVDFDPGANTYNVMSAGLNDAFVQKLDADGNFEWLKQLGGGSPDYGNYIVLDHLENIYTTGTFIGIADFDPGPGVFNLTTGTSSGGSVTAFFSKLDADGNFVWAKNLSKHTRSYSITVDDAGNAYATGMFSSPTDFNPGSAIETLTPGGTTDAFILKLNTNGDYIWAKQFSGINGSGHSRGLTITTDVQGNLYTAGIFGGSGPVDFNPAIGFHYLDALGEGNDIFIHKMSKCQLTANISSDDGFEICRGESLNLMVNEGVNYSWSNGGTDSIIQVSPAISLNYYVTISDVIGCTATDTASIIVHDLPTAEISGNLTICEGESTSLTASGGVNYDWSTTENAPTISVSPTSTSNYAVLVTDSLGCSSSDLVSVNVNPLPLVMINGELEVCGNENTTLSASGGEEYLWSTGDTTATIIVTPLNNPSVSVTVTNEFDCAVEDFVEIIIYELPDISISGIQELCPEDTATLTASGGVDYFWNTGQNSAEIELVVLNSNMYSVTVIDGNNCSNVDSIMLEVNTEFCPPCGDFSLPNVFTPDSDQVNDSFYIFTEGEMQVTDFRVYSRWGNLVHHANEPWDGTFKGEQLPSDVYIYMMTLETGCETKQLRGDITLIR